MFDKSRGGDETRHKYLTHSEWHTDSKFVGLLKVGYQTSILEIFTDAEIDCQAFLHRQRQRVSYFQTMLQLLWTVTTSARRKRR